MQTIVPANSSPMGNRLSAPADTPIVPITVSAFGVTGVRASARPTGFSTRSSTGRIAFSMAVRYYWRTASPPATAAGSALAGPVIGVKGLWRAADR